MLDPQQIEDSCRWIEHRGVRVLMVSYAAARNDNELLDIMARQVTLIRAEAKKVRLLHDYRNSPVGERFLEQSALKSRQRRDEVVQRAAVVGLSGFRKNLFQTYRIESGDTDSRLFETIEEALSWVVE